MVSTASAAMSANELDAGFRLNDWLVEPRERRISRAGGSRPLTAEQAAILLSLAERHGEVVDATTLRARTWPDGAGDDATLRANVHALQEILGDPRNAPDIIVPTGSRGYALVAHFEPLGAGTADTGTAVPVPTPFAPRLVARLQSFIAELRRRHVFKVAGAYLLAAWLVLQVAETTFEPLRLPAWWMTALTILAVTGFPIVAALAWLYEITPGGIVADPSGNGRVVLPRPRRSLAPWLVAGVAAMAAVTGFAWWRTLQQAPDDAARGGPAFASIAILPLIDMSPTGAGQGYLGDGLSEELSARLAQVRGLRVAARTSAFAFRGRNVDVREIGRALGVRHVLEGSVRRQSGRVRVTAQLIDASTGYHAWSESYERPSDDLLSIQEDIAIAITQELKVMLASDVQGSSEQEDAPDPRAYDFYLAGLSQLRQAGSLNRIADAEALFRRALDIDPAFARAHAGLCRAAIVRYDRTRATAAVAAAEAACRKALETGSWLRETELALGRLYVISGRNELGESVFRTLLVHDTRDADAHVGLAGALEGQDRLADAERSFRNATAAEPGYWYAHNRLGSFLVQHGRAQEAVGPFTRVTELAPGNPTGHNNLGTAQFMTGQLDGAAVSFQRSLAIEPARAAYSNLGTVHFFRHQYEQAAGMFTRSIELAPEDHELRGGRADVLWQIESRREDAVADYRQAIALAEKSLEVNPTQAVSWSQLAYYHGRTGNPVQAAQVMGRAFELAPDNPFVNYYAALAAFDRGDEAEAARRVVRAIELGYPAALVKADPVISRFAPAATMTENRSNLPESAGLRRPDP
jgi:TolB-like protein/Tfp pilus assembly protein PilF/DNA-binding winged helix-turn-helix (wHTH) protein